MPPSLQFLDEDLGSLHFLFTIFYFYRSHSARVTYGIKWDKISENDLKIAQKITSVAKEKSEICRISFTFPITVANANENFNLAGALRSQVFLLFNKKLS
jgi:hypothetical protein